MHRTARALAILGAAMALSAAPAFAAEPPPGIAFDGVVTVVFHDPEYDNGNGIEGADVTVVAIDAVTDVIIEEYHATTDANGVASFTDVARPIDPALNIWLMVGAIRDRTSVDPDGCTVGEYLAGYESAPAGVDVSIDVGIAVEQNGRSCPPPSQGPPVIVEGNAVDPDGQALAIVYAEALLEFDELVGIETAADGTFRVEVPAATDPDVGRLLEVTLIGPDVRTVEDEEGCLITWTLVARGSWTLIGDQAPEPTTLVAAEEPLSGVCGGATATPDPPDAPKAPNITLPPTDTIGGGSGIPGGGFAAALMLLLVISLAATIAAERRVSRPGS